MLLDNKEEKKSMANSDWLQNEKETILIYGPPKCGKTWAYCSYIEEVISKGNKVYILNTDAGVSKTFKQYFGEKFPTMAENVKYFFASDIPEARKAVIEIYKDVREHDLVIIDLLSDMWDMAQQQFILDTSGNDPVNFIVKASKDKSKFGMFEGKMWQYIGTLHDFIISPFTARAKCNVIGVCGEKDIEVAGKISGQKNPEYESAGAKPAGHKRLAYVFNTIVYVNKSDSGEKHYFRIMGDRGATCSQEKVTFENKFWNKFVDTRKKHYGQ